MKNIAVFVSGSGSNAENIFSYFVPSHLARVVLIVSDNSEAYALERAVRLGVEHAVVTRAQLRDGDTILRLMRSKDIDYIVLAGFLSLIPAELIEAYPGRIINIHPALLPRYGGKGMYGDNVHRAVIEAGDTQSGITVHHVNEHYDDGAVIAQYRVDVLPADTLGSLAAKIHELEYEYYPKVIESEIRKISNMQAYGRDQ